MFIRHCSARIRDTVGFLWDSLLWAIALMIFRSPIGSQFLYMVSQLASSSILAFMARLHWPWMIVKVLLRLSLRALSLYYQSLYWRPYFSSSCLVGCGSVASVPLSCSIGSVGVCFFRSLMHALRSCDSLKDEHLLRPVCQSFLGIGQRLVVQGCRCSMIPSSLCWICWEDVITVISISPHIQSLSAAMVLLLYKLDYTIEVSMLVASVDACYSDWS